jgi:hypothetical protein
MTRRRFLYTAGATTLAVAGSRLLRWSSPAPAVVDGQVLAAGGSAIGNARLTLFTPDLSFFREARSNGAGQYAIQDVPFGVFQLGCGAVGFEYQEITVSVSTPSTTRNFGLGPELHLGSWAVIGSTAPEVFGGTNSGTLLSDGRIFYCHDATDPILFNPLTGLTTQAAPSASRQGCHMPTHLPDGRLLIVGGGTVDDSGNFSPGEYAVNKVKAFDPASNTWENWPDLNEPRWYPGLARLADGRLLLFGGGQQPDQLRTATCEILDPRTRQSTPTGSMLKAGGFGPAGLLNTGEVLVTWDPPQLYNPTTGQWRLAGPFRQPLRATVESCPLPHQRPAGQVPFIGDHPDHTALHLPDGRVVAVGLRRAALGTPGSMVEFYDPAADSWSLGTSTSPLRSMAEVLLLPTGQIFVAGGKKEDPEAGDPVNAWCQLKRADLYDPVADVWRQLADMGDFREYHAITLLAPDGRVLTTAGVSQPGVNPPEGSNNSIEAFSPPYLFRGIRPRIDSLSTTRFSHGQRFTLQVAFTNAVTSVVLMGMNAISHWTDGGVPRLLRLDFNQTPLAGSVQVTAQIPTSPIDAPVGHYLLFALVDDIPSVARIVAVEADQVYLPAVLR